MTTSPSTSALVSRRATAVRDDQSDKCSFGRSAGASPPQRPVICCLYTGATAAVLLTANLERRQHVRGRERQDLCVGVVKSAAARDEIVGAHFCKLHQLARRPSTSVADASSSSSPRIGVATRAMSCGARPRACYRRLHGYSCARRPHETPT